MSTTIEDRLRDHYNARTADLPRQGPGIDTIVVRANCDNAYGGRPVGKRVAVMTGLAAAAVVALLAVTNRTDSPSGAAGSTLTAEPVIPPSTAVSIGLQPVVTLPPTADVFDVPITEEGTSPTGWYRLQPDLDVANLPALFCWRTPVDTACIADDSTHHPLPLVVPTGGGQTLVMVSGDPSQRSLDVTLSDGTVLNAPLAWDPIVSWGVARFALPPATSISLVGGQAAPAAPSATLEAFASTPAYPVTDETTATPVTVSAGSPLTYWRFLPDLEISEREATTASGTELCWKTPVGKGCLDDTFNSPQVGLIPTDGGLIALTRPALILVAPPPSDPSAPKFTVGPNPTTVTAILSDGTTLTAEVQYTETFGVGYARLSTPTRVTVISATSG
jgi:hypothetical protein